MHQKQTALWWTVFFLRLKLRNLSTFTICICILVFCSAQLSQNGRPFGGLAYIYIWFHTFPAIFHCTARRIWVVSNDQALQAKRKVSRPMSPRDWPQIKVVVVGMVAELRHLRKKDGRHSMSRPPSSIKPLQAETMIPHLSGHFSLHCQTNLSCFKWPGPSGQKKARCQGQCLQEIGHKSKSHNP